MSEKIYRENATKKDRPILPPGMRYSLYCKPTLEKERGVDCESKETDGLLGYYGDSKSAEEAGLAHPHPVLIRFYPIHQASHYDF